MSTETGEKPAASLFDKLISRQRHPLITAAIGLLLTLPSIGAAWLDGVVDDFFSQGHWRLLLLPPTVIVYILIVAPILTRVETSVIQAFRPLVLKDDDSFDRLVSEASRVNPLGEVIAFSVGAVLGLWIGQTWLSGEDVFWLKLSLPLCASLMFGLLGSAIYSTMASTGLTAELHRQPLRVDIFNTKPFAPIGRQSLSIALVFVAGIALSMVFGFDQESFFDWRNWLIIVFLALVPVLVFFLNMRDTHRVLAAEKKRELEAVQRNILLACRTLMQRMAANESTGTLAAEINALVAYEARLLAARTWPYDTAMLRTLFFSVIFPGGAALAQVVFETLFK
jgi:hypothetical protein